MTTLKAITDEAEAKKISAQEITDEARELADLLRYSNASVGLQTRSWRLLDLIRWYTRGWVQEPPRAPEDAEEVIRKAKAEAWDEGREAGMDDWDCTTGPVRKNPYREEAKNG